MIQDKDNKHQAANDLNVEDEKLPLLDNGVNNTRLKQSKFKLNRKFLLIPVVIGIFATGGFVGLYFQPPGLQFFMKVTGLTPGGGTSHPIAVSQQQEAIPESDSSINTVKALGTLLPLKDVSILAPPYGANDARIAQLNVQEGDHVKRSEVIAVMDNDSKLQAELENSQADVQVAQAQLEQIKASITNARLKAMAEVESVEANYHQAKNDLVRGKELKKSGVITQSELDRLIAIEESTSRSLDSAKANLANYQYSDINSQADVKLASSNLLAAKAKLNAKQQDLASATLRAPSDGVIIAVHARVGERPSGNGIVTFGDTSQMQAKLEVYQSDVQYLQLGAPVSMRSNALGDVVLSGKIIRIGLEVRKQQLIATSPAANTDARIVIVNVALDQESTKQAASLNGLEVTATIQGLRTSG
ncbi:efflux RND transporter periplasmic adaptor subunit [Glaciecola sp. MF2-115]|uniref:efflux RND transporter periplasmic adaptor subunit n=1 Tax=Glaciecola sp. MF2-115 TaxID=3384827 RepID=UPI0039A27D4F